MKSAGQQRTPAQSGTAGGFTAWLLRRFGSGARPRARLALLERIALSPRQSLSLVEVEGRRFLVATSGEGAPAFYPLEGRSCSQQGVRRASW